MDVHKTLYPFYTTKKMPHVVATLAKMGFVASHFMILFPISHPQIFKTGYFHKSIAITTKETTICDFILPSKIS